MHNRKLPAITLAVSTLCFIFLAVWVTTGGSKTFDNFIRAGIHSDASPGLTRFLLAITTLGSEWFMVPLGAIVFWRLWTVGRRRDAIAVPLVTLSAELVSNILKVAFYRARPDVFFELARAGTYSFPSGHAFVSTVFYALLTAIVTKGSGRGPARLVPLLLLVPLIGVSRVYLGYHYPSDVMGGWACAVAWLSLWCLFGLKIDLGPQSEKEQN